MAGFEVYLNGRFWVSPEGRSQKSILVFLAQDAESHVFCYSKADLLKRDQAEGARHESDGSLGGPAQF